MIKKLKVKKTYKGLVELRDYDVKDCIKSDTTIKVEYGGDVMSLSPIQLRDDVKAISDIFPSKNGGKSYKLYGYTWEPI